MLEVVEGGCCVAVFSLSTPPGTCLSVPCFAPHSEPTPTPPSPTYSGRRLDLVVEKFSAMEQDVDIFLVEGMIQLSPL